MKTNKKTRNELLFALMIVALAALFAFTRIHITKDRQTAGADTTEILPEHWVVLIFHTFRTAERRPMGAVPCMRSTERRFAKTKRQKNLLKRRKKKLFRRFNSPETQFTCRDFAKIDFTHCKRRLEKANWNGKILFGIRFSGERKIGWDNSSFKNSTSWNFSQEIIRRFWKSL